MKVREDKVTMTHHDFSCLMREYQKMALELDHKRYLAKCATLCLNQVVTNVVNGDDEKNLCYRRDNEYISIAKKCLE